MKIPTYEMQGRTTSEAPAVRISPDTYGQNARNLETLGSTIADVSFKVKQAYDEETSLRAQTALNQKVTSLKTEMMSDPDLNANKDYYFKEFNSARDSALKGVGNPATKNRLVSKFQDEEMFFNHDFTTQYRSQQIKRTEAEGLRKADSIKTKWPTMTNEQRVIEWQLQMGWFDGMVAQNFMDEPTSQKAKFALRDSISKSEWDRQQNVAILNGKDAADKFMKETLNHPDFFGNSLDETEKAKYIKSTIDMQGNLRKRADAEAKETNRLSRVNFLMDVVQNKKDIGSLDIATVAQHDPEFAGAIEKYKTRETWMPSGVGATGQAERGFFNAAQSVFNLKDNESLNKFMISTIGSKTSGVSDTAKLGIFTFLAQRQGEANRAKTPEELKSRGFMANVRSALGAIAKYSPGRAPQIGNELLRNIFVNKLETSKEISAARDEIVTRHTQETVPGIDHLKKADGTPGVPNKILEGYGPVEDVYDGENQLEGDVYADSSADTRQE